MLDLSRSFFKKEREINKDRFQRVNERIRFSPIVLIDETGNNIGEIATSEALRRARENGLDLVEINPTSRPPICKIMDYGKHKYDLAKREKESKSRQKETELKEIRLTAKISDHDIDYKAKKAKDFFERGNKVKVSMRLRGRENVFVAEALTVFGKFSAQAGLAYESNPIKQGNTISGMLSKPKENKSSLSKE